MHTIVCKLVSGKLLYKAGSPTQCCEDLEGVGWEGDGRAAQEGESICIHTAAPGFQHSRN